MTDQPGPGDRRPGIGDLIAERDAHDKKMDDLIAIGEAERVVADARFTEVDAAWRAAVRRHRAAKGLLTRARKDSSAEKITAAAQREREASAEADRILKESYAEVNLIIRGGLDRAAEFHDQWDQAQAARDAVTEARARHRDGGR